MELFHLTGVLWLICWYLYFFTKAQFPYKKPILTCALSLLILLSIHFKIFGIEISAILIVSWLLFFIIFLKNKFLVQASLIATFLTTFLIHFIFYILSIVSPKIFLGFEQFIEIVIIYIFSQFFLRSYIGILSSVITGVLFGEMIIQFFNRRNFGVDASHFYSGFTLVAGFVFLTFVQFILHSKKFGSKKRLLYRNR